MSTIDSKVQSLAAAGFNVGAPLSEEVPVREGGFMRTFEEAVIIDHPAIGCFEVHGAILKAYIDDGGVESSSLGYPTSDESDDPNIQGGKYNTFQFGTITWSSDEGAVIHLQEESPTDDGTVAVEQMPNKLVIKLSNENPLSTADHLSLADLSIEGFDDVPALEKLYNDEDRQFLGELSSQAKANDPDYTLSDFGTYYTADLPKEKDLTGLLQQLNNHNEVEFAYASEMPVLCTIAAADDPAVIFQNYLFAAPVGVDATSAWDKNITGKDIKIVDIEHGWDLDHEDLPVIPLTNVNRSGGAPHGTAVLGELVAQDNDRGIVGTAPEASVEVVSIFTGKTSFSTEKALVKAMKLTGAGNIILIELQDPSLFPIEIVPGVFQLIELATKAGIIVIEPAGNGSHKLDEYHFFLNGKKIFNRTSADFKDSGSIIVGAASSKDPHSRLSFSNFGSRVDCYAWGENVETLGINNTYINNFNGTSSASPIITGAAALVQQYTQSQGNALLTPLAMRNVLSDPSTATLSANPSQDQIGVMPDLSKIIV